MSNELLELIEKTDELVALHEKLDREYEELKKKSEEASYYKKFFGRK